MKEEKIKILQMVEEGKISVDDALKLLDAMKHDKSGHFYRFREDSDIEAKLHKFSKNVEIFAKDLGCKMEDTFKDMEPKFKSTTKAIIEKTACVIDEISKSLNESLKNMEENRCESNQDCDCGCGCSEQADNEPKEN